jgi:hypothetical protein
VAASQIAIIDRSAASGSRKVVGTFFSHGREAHGLWTNPENTLLYIAHEQDELPSTPNAGQTVCDPLLRAPQKATDTKFLLTRVSCCDTATGNS